MSCREDHCVTCSDEGVAMRVLQPGPEALCVDEAGEQALVMTDLVGAVEPGDAVLVHAGVALTRLEEAQA